MEHVIKASKDQARLGITQRWLSALYRYFISLPGWKRTVSLALVLGLPLTLTLQPIRNVVFRVFGVFGAWSSNQASKRASIVNGDEEEFPDLYEASVMELQAGLDAGRFTSVDLVKTYLARIDEVNLNGPGLRAILELNPSALSQAVDMDKERRSYGKRSLMHGIPILVKDNIATMASEGMNTTAGSYSLLGSIVPEDAGVVKRLRRAGAIIIGKANLSEFSYFRGERGELPSGWSGRGGQCTNAYYPNADPCGSSSGSGVAASIGLATVTLGTETDGSIMCPSSLNNVVGIKPTVGLTSRAGVIPISSSQDSVGPMTRSVADAAIVLSVISGKDKNDDATLSQPSIVPDYTKALSKDALKGKRIGVPRRVYMDEKVVDDVSSVAVAFEEALNVLKNLGATIVDPADLPSAVDLSKSEYESLVLDVECKIGLNAYLAALKESPTGVRSVADIIKFNDDNPALEKPEGCEGQGRLIGAEKSQGKTAAYLEALAFDYEYGRTRGIDAVLKEHNLDALVLPTVRGTWTPAAIAGYPIITVPLGFYPDDIPIKQSGNSTTRLVSQAPGMPFGISFFSTAYSEFELIGLAYAYEQATHARLARKAYPEAIPKTQLNNIV
ncbi:amidase signature enzyme [Pholiota conissans]|uniref:Amidase signature enzyme n=1 Tax=Pholiota conissans TaxID=109636 RepID=A0A9P5ZBP2_9AGAR|nr:amidase signature enzyme [Pholiota conissans]